MVFKEDHIYHVFNRGNNRQKIFFEDRNYLYFIEKIKRYISPYSNIIAWCLMPNHFHLMLRVKVLEFENVTINNSIGRMLSSYTSGVNKDMNQTGSLFQKRTKAICLSVPKLEKVYYKSKPGLMNIYSKNKDYPSVCMDYIHMNPVRDGLVIQPEDWKYSSYREYIENSDCTLVNLEEGRFWFD